MTRDDSGAPDDVRRGDGRRAAFAVAGGALLLLLIGLLVPRTCPTTMMLTGPDTHCGLPDYRPAVALVAAAVVVLGCILSAAAARGPSATRSRNVRIGIVVAAAGGGFGFVVLMALASGLVLAALR